MILQENQKLSQPKVLIIEDDMDAAKNHVRQYRQLRICCETASSGKEGVEKAKLHDPDVIILDLFLPDTTGVKVCKKPQAEGKKHATYR